MANSDDDDLTTSSSSPTDSAIGTSSVLSSRYGRTRRRRLRDRWLLVGGAVLVVVAITSWGVWSNWGQDSQTSVISSTAAYSIPDAYHVTLHFTIDAPANKPVTCALEAMNEQFAIVGWKIQAFPPAPRGTMTYTQTLLTTQQSVTGLINNCWLT